MGTATEEVPEVVGQRADVGAARARHVDRQHHRVGGGGDVEALDRHGPRRPLDLDPLASQLVEPAPVDVDRRHHRRHLLDVTDEMGGDGLPGIVER